MSLRGGYGRTDDRLEEFLVEIGRRKFIKPLYEELVKTDSGRRRAPWPSTGRRGRATIPSAWTPSTASWAGRHERGATAASTHVESACPLDCPDACSLDVTVERRPGRRRSTAATRTRSRAATSAPRCGATPTTSTGRSRLLAPARARGPQGRGTVPSAPRGTRRSASWRTSSRGCATAAAGRRSCPSPTAARTAISRRTRRTPASSRRLGASRLAADGVRRARHGAPPGALRQDAGRRATHDYAHARLIVRLGSEPLGLGHPPRPVHPGGAEARGQARGRRSAAHAARRAAPTCTSRSRPGTDLPLALSALIRWLFAGRPRRPRLPGRARAAAPTSCARRAEPVDLRARGAEIAGVGGRRRGAFRPPLRGLQPAVVRCGWGLERNRNGGSAVAAVLALPAVAGKFGVRGGGYTPQQLGRVRPIDTDGGGPGGGAETRTVNMNQLGAGADREGEPPVGLAVRLQLQPARDDAARRSWCAKASSARTSSPWSSSR